jgi:hypothetical protein
MLVLVVKGPNMPLRIVLQQFPVLLRGHRPRPRDARSIDIRVIEYPLTVDIVVWPILDQDELLPRLAAQEPDPLISFRDELSRICPQYGAGLKIDRG